MARPRFASLRPDLLALAIILALPSSFALAQEAEKIAEPTKPATLETVTVTAERRVQDIQDVPVSITAISGEKLDVIKSGGDDIRLLSDRLPSLQIESSFGRAFPRFYVRGLGNNDFDLNASQPVSLVYDDVVQENPILKGFPIFDVDQVELLRGPQGTLFGRNSTAGVVKFDSVKPSQEFGGYGRISYGTYGTTNVEGAVNGALSPTVSARFSALYQHRDNWVDNTFTGEDNALEGYDDYAARLQLLFAPSDDFEALFNVHTRHLNGTARLFRSGIIVPGSNDLISGFDRDKVSIDGTNSQELDALGGSARLTWNFGNVSLYSITGYETVEVFSRGDIDGASSYDFPPSGPGEGLFAAESADGLPNHRQLSQEFRLQSNDWGRFDWQAGLFWFSEDITVDSFDYQSTGFPFSFPPIPNAPNAIPPGGQSGYAQQRQDNKAWAVFISGDYDVSEAWKLSGGLRYTKDEKEFSAYRAYWVFADPFGTAGPIPTITVKPSDSNVSWNLSSLWAVSDQVNLYMRVATGFRAPSIQGRLLYANGSLPDDQLVTVADTETVLSYEAGVKANLFDNRVRVSFDVFKYRITDQQLTAVGGISNTARLVNAANTDGDGFELDVEAYVTENLLVTFGTSLNNTKIDDPNLSSVTCPGFVCTVLDPAGPVPGTALLDGNSLPHAPKWINSLTARYTIPMGANEFFVYLDAFHRSEVNFFIYDSAEFTGKPLTELGLRFGYIWADGQNELSLFGRNLTDEEAIIGGIDFNNLTGMMNEPRMVGLEFKSKF